MTVDEFRELSEQTHNGRMNHSLDLVCNIYERQGMHPCAALKLAQEVMEPAFTAWGTLLDVIQVQAGITDEDLRRDALAGLAAYDQELGI